MTVEELTRPQTASVETLAELVERGLARHRQGDFAAAENLYRQALAHAPEDGAIWKLLGIVLQQEERAGDARQALERAVSLVPNDGDVHRFLALARSATGATEEALSSARTAVSLDPENAENHRALGRVLRAAGQPEAAVAALSEAARREPHDLPTVLDMAHGLREQSRFRLAKAAYAHVLRLEPGHVDALNGLGVALYEEGDFDAACRCYAEAYDRNPDALEALINYANILLKRHDIAGALALYEHAIALRPQQSEFLYNYANCLDWAGRYEEAVACYGEVLALKPSHMNAFWNRTLAKLTAGRLAEAWPDYERRWEVATFQSPRFTFTQPLWDGSPLEGKTLLLHAEQGFGDTVQFIRYAPLLAERGARVILQCQQELVRLLQGAAGVSAVISWQDPPPAHDFQLPLMSVCHRFGTDLDSIPASPSYLSAAPAALPVPGLLNVGLVWAGNPGHLNDVNRSIPFETITALLGVPDVRFYSLQFGAKAQSAPELTDLTFGIKDFADTAARIAALDLVISVDTSTVHLAGALGRPTLLLLPVRNDWRWFRDREDTPWYPTVRLLRQPRSGDWAAVIARARVMVEALVETRRRKASAVAARARPAHLDLLETGLAHHRAGDFEAAEEAYAAALRRTSDDAQLCTLAGIVALQRGDAATAVARLEAGLDVSPDDPALLTHLSTARREAGDHAGAAAAGRQAVKLRPDDGEAQFALGRALLWTGDHEEAADALSQALRGSDRPEITHFLGIALAGAGHAEKAILAFREALARDPANCDALNRLGILLRDRGDLDGAVRCYARVIETQPDHVDALANYANVLIDLNALDDALALLDHALARHPEHVEITYNRAFCLSALHRFEEALAGYDRVLAICPAHGGAAWNRTLLLLTQGRWREGLDLYERRWDVPQMAATRRHFAVPLWRGEALAGRTLLLHGEQGLGDTLQFVRYAPLLAERGAKVVLQCQKGLVRLLRGMQGLAEVVPEGGVLPPFDLHLPIMSVAQRFATMPETVPPPVPYPSVIPVTLGGEPVRVGLVWAGNPGHRNDVNRSIPFEALAPLLIVAEVEFFSLQVGAPVPVRDELTDLGSSFADLADTAAAVAALDLVITVDTSVAHLAGTLGRKTFLLLALRSDWRWLSGRADTPWYSSVQLFRQTRSGDWRTVVAEVSAALSALVAGGRAATGGRARLAC